MAKKRETKDSQKASPSPKSPFPWGVIAFLVSAVIPIVLGVYMYTSIMSPVDAPKLDPEQWWGPLPKDPKQDLSVRPYKIEFSDVMINDLRERLLHTRPFRAPLDGAGFTYGFNTNFLTQVLDFWKNKYDFKDREQFLNKYPHYVTNIQGLDIHFMRVTPKPAEGIKVVPLLLVHGWPGSVREFYELIPLLTTPRTGRDFVFDVIVPSLPGYGFSQAAVRPGLGSTQVSVIMNNLMSRLNIDKYYVQGGDWGHAICSALATLYQDRVLGFHSNMPVAALSLPAFVKTLVGSVWPALVVEPELYDRMYPLKDHFAYILEEFGYMHLQATKPDTVGVGLTDSPAGLAAYILEKFSTWTNRSFKQSADGELLKKYSLTNLLDNVMIYWSTNSITTSMRLYAESMSKEHMSLSMDRVQTTVPTWGIKFKYELSYTPDEFLRLKFVNYLQSTVVEDGGHFAAFENPNILADDIFKAVDAFIKFHKQQKVNEEKKKKIDEEVFEHPKTIYDFTAKDINGNEVKLDRYKGHVLIIVNVASNCGLTDKNYEQLNELYEKYSTSKGLRILAFPCNQFASQEPGSFKDIINFTKSKGVKFDLFEKIDVNGEKAHPLWKFLKNTQGGTMGDFIKWNFSKFIVNKNGVPVERLGPNVDPKDLVPLLEKYW